MIRRDSLLGRIIDYKDKDIMAQHQIEWVVK